MSTTKTKPDAQMIADAVHGIPAPSAAVEHAIPPRDLIPVDLHPLLDDLTDAHQVLATAKAALAAAVANRRTAKDDYTREVYDELRRPGGDAGAVVNREGELTAAEDHARRVMKAARARVAEAHYVLTEALLDRRDEILTLVTPVAEADAADERAALAALAEARSRLSASRGILQWLGELDPGAGLKAKRPYRT